MAGQGSLQAWEGACQAPVPVCPQSSRGKHLRDCLVQPRPVFFPQAHATCAFGTAQTLMHTQQWAVPRDGAWASGLCLPCCGTLGDPHLLQPHFLLYWSMVVLG